MKCLGVSRTWVARLINKLEYTEGFDVLCWGVWTKAALLTTVGVHLFTTAWEGEGDLIHLLHY